MGNLYLHAHGEVAIQADFERGEDWYVGSAPIRGSVFI